MTLHRLYPIGAAIADWLSGGVLGVEGRVWTAATWVDKPVQEQVTLREEYVTVDRRAARRLDQPPCSEHNAELGFAATILEVPALAA